MVKIRHIYNYVEIPFKETNGISIKKVDTVVRRATEKLKTAKDTFTKEITESKPESNEFNPKTGCKLKIQLDRQRALVRKITPNKKSQNLVLRMVNNEAVVVTPKVEKQVMKTQFETYMRGHTDIKPEDIYIFSPKPKGETKSYSRSGDIFSEVNGIDKTHIMEDFKSIPENAVVFMPDDCSITGASMVFDLLDKLPSNFKGNIVFAPTVKGAGRNLKNNEMAEEVLDSLSLINKQVTTRDKVVTRLTNLISDNKKRNIEILEKLRNSENYKNLHITIAEGSLPAKNFRKTETFKSMPKHEQAIIDRLFTAEGINKGYHDSGVMVLLPHKTPNNNVGIMSLFGKELGLETKPTGILDYAKTMEIKQSHKTCAIGIMPACNSKGNTSRLLMEFPNMGGKFASIPYEGEHKTVAVKIKHKNGETSVINYTPKLESKTEASEHRLLGFEVPKEIDSYITTLKGDYKPKTVNKDFGYYVDVLAIPKTSKIESINEIPIRQLIFNNKTSTGK